MIKITKSTKKQIPKNKDNIWRMLNDFSSKGKYRYPISPVNNKLIPANIFKVFGETKSGKIIKSGSENITKLFRSKRPKIFASFGINIHGEAIIKDYAKVRQLLISGAQGSGKTNALTHIVLSMLWGNHPEALKFFVFDIKRELSLLREVCTTYDEEETIKTGIQLLSCEMEKRYREMAIVGCRSIDEWNDYRQDIGLDPVGYIIVIIDEYASTSALLHSSEESFNFNKHVEILSSTGRAAGIYLILCTQRADRDSLKPAIKANIISNLAFAQRGIWNAQIAGVEEAQNIRKVGNAIFDSGLDNIKVIFPEIKLTNLKHAIDALKKHTES